MFTFVVARAIAIIAAMSLSTLAAANVIEGKAEVIDGDSLRVEGREVRLFGVDAPEYTQTCFDNGAAVPCGAMAKDALEGLIGSGVLVCVSQGTDTYGRSVARCRTSGVDVGDALVLSGWATAFRRYTDEYVAAEARARASRVGIWQWDFQSPEDFRASRKTATEQPSRTRAAAPATTPPAGSRKTACA